MLAEVLDPVTHAVVISSRVTNPSGLASEILKWLPEPTTSFTFERGRQRQKDLGLRIALEEADPNDDLLLPSHTGHPLDPNSRHFIRLWAGYFVTPLREELLPIGTFTLNESVVADRSGAAVVELRAVDKTLNIERDFPDVRSYAEDDLVTDTVDALLTEFLPTTSEWTIAASEWTIPLIEVEEGDSVSALIDELLDGIGFEMTTDRMGLIRVSHIANTFWFANDPPAWYYGDGDHPDTVPIQAVEMPLTEPDGYHGSKVFGAALGSEDTPIETTVWDEDPTSRTYYDISNPPANPRVYEQDLPLIRNGQQLAEAASYLLKRHGNGGQEIQFEALPNPGLQPDQAVFFSWSRLGIDLTPWMILSVDLPAEPSGLMKVRARRSWDPFLESGTVGPPDPGPGVPSSTDNFNAYSSLGDYTATSHLYDEADWLTVGNGVLYTRDQRIHAGSGMCLGYHLDQLTSTNAYSEILISPSDGTKGGFESWNGPNQGMGALVRYPGSGAIKGYAAMAFPDDYVRLYRYDSTSDRTLLLEVDYGSTLVNRTIRVEASGSSILMKVDAVQQGGTQTDGSHTSGQYAGVIANQGWVDDFADGNL